MSYFWGVIFGGSFSPITLSFSTAPALTRTVTWNGKQWREYQVASSCTLTVTGQPPANCYVWACGGGAGGHIRTRGGGGGYAAQVSGALPASAVITIGAGEAGKGAGDSTGGGATSFGSMLSAAGGLQKNGGGGVDSNIRQRVRSRRHAQPDAQNRAYARPDKRRNRHVPHNPLDDLNKPLNHHRQRDHPDKNIHVNSPLFSSVVP
ncbi:hypothetical protein FACS1894196_4510 [Clostridia bacterium]|nr:hypothetical protein FACS1894196_4510 [Clostridia bacterium]